MANFSKMRQGLFVPVLSAGLAVFAMAAGGAVQAQQSQQDPGEQGQKNRGQQQAPGGKGRPGRGGGGWMGAGMRDGLPGGARGLMGAVTEAGADHFVVKTETGELYTVHFSVNTRIMRQPAGGRRLNFDGNLASEASGSRPRGGNGAGGDDSADSLDRQVPATIKPLDIKVGDLITAGGEMDVAQKSVGAIVIMQIDAERAKELREMQANFGKTWLAGRITSIEGTRITIEGMLDRASHAIDVDENTSFRQRRESITLADIKPGEQLRAEGSNKDGNFRATVINAFQPQGRDQPTAPGGVGTSLPQ